MQINTHPKTKKTLIISTDGSSFNLNWIYYKKRLKLNNNYRSYFLWKNKNLRKILTKFQTEAG